MDIYDENGALILLLAGGKKSTQSADIARAKQMVKDIEQVMAAKKKEATKSTVTKPALREIAAKPAAKQEARSVAKPRKK